jgi:hypothetical protein
MCRNIRVLHRFQPPTTPAEIRAAAFQYVRKVSGIRCRDTRESRHRRRCGHHRAARRARAASLGHLENERARPREVAHAHTLAHRQRARPEKGARAGSGERTAALPDNAIHASCKCPRHGGQTSNCTVARRESLKECARPGWTPLRTLGRTGLHPLARPDRAAPCDSACRGDLLEALPGCRAPAVLHCRCSTTAVLCRSSSDEDPLSLPPRVSGEPPDSGGDLDDGPDAGSRRRRPVDAGPTFWVRPPTARGGRHEPAASPQARATSWSPR